MFGWFNVCVCVMKSRIWKIKWLTFIRLKYNQYLQLCFYVVKIVNMIWELWWYNKTCKRLIFRPKTEIATWSCKDRDGVVRSGRQNATGVLSRPERDRSTVATRPQNATYRAVAFTGSAPESDRDLTCSWFRLTMFWHRGDIHETPISLYMLTFRQNSQHRKCQGHLLE